MANDVVLADKKSGLLLPPNVLKDLKAQRRIDSMRLYDRYVNRTNQFGQEGYDPQTGTYFEPENPLTIEEIDSHIRHNWLARRMISAMPRTATREGFYIEINDTTEDEKLKDAEKRLEDWEILKKLRDGGTMANGYGAAALIPRFEDGNIPEYYQTRLDQVIDIAKIHIVERLYCRPAAYYNRPWDRRRHLEPLLYHANIARPRARTWETGYFHESRVKWIESDFLPDRLRTHNMGDPDSLLIPVQEVLKNFGTTIQAINGLIQDYVIKKLKVNNLEEMLDEDNPDGLEQIERITAAANAELSIHKMALIDGEGEMEKITTSITGLPDIVVINMDMAAAAIDIPKSLLFGNLTGTLGSASGYHDRINFYERAEFYQSHTMTPILKPFVFLACFLSGIPLEKVGKIKIVWNPIRDLGRKDEADASKLEAEARKIDKEIEKTDLEIKKLKKDLGE